MPSTADMNYAVPLMSHRIKFCGKPFFKNRAGKKSLFFHYLCYANSGRVAALYLLGSVLALIFGFLFGYFPEAAFWGPVIGCFFSFNFAVFGYIYLIHVDHVSGVGVPVLISNQNSYFGDRPEGAAVEK